MNELAIREMVYAVDGPPGIFNNAAGFARWYSVSIMDISVLIGQWVLNHPGTWTVRETQELRELLWREKHDMIEAMGGSAGMLELMRNGPYEAVDRLYDLTSREKGLDSLGQEWFVKSTYQDPCCYAWGGKRPKEQYECYSSPYLHSSCEAHKSMYVDSQWDMFVARYKMPVITAIIETAKAKGLV